MFSSPVVPMGLSSVLVVHDSGMLEFLTALSDGFRHLGVQFAVGRFGDQYVISYDFGFIAVIVTILIFQKRSILCSGALWKRYNARQAEHLFEFDPSRSTCVYEIISITFRQRQPQWRVSFI